MSGLEAMICWYKRIMLTNKPASQNIVCTAVIFTINRKYLYKENI